MIVGPESRLDKVPLTLSPVVLILQRVTMMQVMTRQSIMTSPANAEMITTIELETLENQARKNLRTHEKLSIWLVDYVPEPVTLLASKSKAFMPLVFAHNTEPYSEMLRLLCGVDSMTYNWYSQG